MREGERIGRRQTTEKKRKKNCSYPGHAASGLNSLTGGSNSPLLSLKQLPATLVNFLTRVVAIAELISAH